MGHNKPGSGSGNGKPGQGTGSGGKAPEKGGEALVQTGDVQLEVAVACAAFGLAAMAPALPRKRG